MPNYTVNEGHRAIIGGQLVEGGDKVTLDADAAERLVDTGVLLSTRRNAKPAASGGRRSGWTPSDESSDDTEDDSEEG